MIFYKKFYTNVIIFEHFFNLVTLVYVVQLIYYIIV